MAECDTDNASFVALDIENFPNGDVITIAIGWRETKDAEPTVKVFGEWSTFWDWLIPVARKDKRFRTIYAHNGGGWDWLSLTHFLLNEGHKEYQSLYASTAASKMITLTVRMESRFTITFADSLQLLRSPLAELAKKFDVTNKVNIGDVLPHVIFASDRELYQRYIRADVVALIEILENSLRLIRDKVAKIDTFGFTIGSTAMKIFKTMGLAKPIEIPWDEGVKNFLREGYRGGRVEVFQGGHYEDVRVYDINSLYPFAMLTTDVPVSSRGEWVSRYDPNAICAAYRVEFTQYRKDIPPVLMVGGVGQYNGEGVYFQNELDLLREVDSRCLITVRSGYVFHDCEKVFQNYVNCLYNLRLEYPDDPISLLAKYLLNSLYGKMGQHSEREQIIKVNDAEALYDLIPEHGESKVRELNEHLGTQVLTVIRECKFEHVGIAGTITSAARCILYRGMMEAGTANVLYCDTDSVHMIGELPDSMVGKAIGKFKLEFHGEGVYCGKKLYALRDNLGKTKHGGNACVFPPKIRAKGVSVGGRNGFHLRFADFVSMVAGEVIPCTFQQPATAKEVFSGKRKPCEFGPRKRRLRKVVV
jgi:hypothetical protein